MIAQRKFEEKNPFYKENKIMIKLLKTIFKIAANAVKTPWQNCQSNEKKVKICRPICEPIEFSRKPVQMWIV